MADKIVSWGGFDSKGTSGMGVTGSLSLIGNLNFQPGTTGASRYISMSASPTTASGNSIVIQAGDATAAGTGGSVSIQPGGGAGGPGAGTVTIGNTTWWNGATINGTLTVTNQGPNTGTALTVNAGGQVAMRWDWDNINLVTSVVSTAGRILRFTGASQYQVRGSGTTSSTTSFLVQNANASASLQITDDQSIIINGSSSMTIANSGSALTVKRAGSYGNIGSQPLLNIIDDTNHSNVSKTAVYISATGASDNRAMEIYGGVGIGTFAYATMLRVSYPTYLNNTASIFVGSNFGLSSKSSISSYAANNGGGISFWGDDRGQANAAVAFAGIRGVKENSTYLNSLGNLVFYVQTGSAGGLSESTYREVARFNSSGSFGIGTTNPTSTLHVSGSSRFTGELLMSGSTQNRSVKLTDSGLYISRTSDGIYPSTITADGVMYFDTRNSFIFRNDGTATITFQSDTRNVLIGPDTSDLGRLVVKGSGTTTSTKTFLLQNSSNTQLGYVDDSGRWQIGPGTNSGYALEVSGSARISSTNSGYKLILRTTGEGSGAGLVVDQLGYYMLDVNTSDIYMRPFPNAAGKVDLWSWNSYGGPTNVFFVQNSQYHVSTDNPTGIKVPIIKFPDAASPIIMGNIATSAIRGYLTVGGTFYASASLGASQRIVSTVSAIANNDTLIGLDVLPTFSTGSYTGVTSLALRVSGSATISNVLTLSPQDPLPSGVPTGSFAVSSSAPPKPYFYDGTVWNALY